MPCLALPNRDSRRDGLAVADQFVRQRDNQGRIAQFGRDQANKPPVLRRPLGSRQQVNSRTSHVDQDFRRSRPSAASAPVKSQCFHHAPRSKRSIRLLTTSAVREYQVSAGWMPTEAASATISTLTSRLITESASHS